MRKFTSFLFLALLVTLLNAQERETIVSWTFSSALTPEQMLPNTSGTGSGNFYFTSTHATPATSFNNTFGRPAVRFNNHLAHPDDTFGTWHLMPPDIRTLPLAPTYVATAPETAAR